MFRTAATTWPIVGGFGCVEFLVENALKKSLWAKSQGQVRKFCKKKTGASYSPPGPYLGSERIYTSVCNYSCTYFLVLKERFFFGEVGVDSWKNKHEYA